MTAITKQLDPRKSPAQRRSRETCEAILEAAARILESEGRHRLTTNHVAERAGVSIGSLYQYFPSKQAIVAALIRRMRAEMLADFEAAARSTAEMGLAGAAEALIEASIRHHLNRPALAQALEREEAELALDNDIQAMKLRMREIVVELLRSRGVADADCAAFDLIAISHGLADAAVQAGQRDFADLSARLRRAVFGYLQPPPQA